MTVHIEPTEDLPHFTSASAASAFCEDLLRLIRQTAPHLNTGATAVPLEKLSVPVDLTLRYSVSFNGKATRFKGPLPEDVQAAASEESLRAMIENRIRIAGEEAGPLIDAWANGQAQDYRREPKPSDFLKERPAFGFQETCSQCGGEAQVACSTCHRSGTVDCSTCGGSGNVNCHSCGGTSSTRCTSCAGMGYREETVWMLDAVKQQETASQMTQVRRIACSSCGGSGSNRCYICSGGKVRCSGCYGQGTVNCPHCGTRGVVPCDSCSATGATHQLGSVECSIQKEERLEVSGGEEDRETLTRRVPAQRLNDLAPLQLESSSRNGAALTLQYSAGIPVESARVTVGNETIAIRAYGPGREVYHYHFLAEELLAPDLEALEANLKGGGLIPSIRRFLEPEIHAALAHSASGAEFPPQAARAIEKGLISEDYARRAAGTLAKAAPEIYGKAAWGRGKWFAGGTALAFVLVRFAPMAGFNAGAALWGAAIAAAGSWFFVEWTLRKDLETSLGASFYQRLAPAISRPRNKFRWIAGGAIGAIWFLTGFPRALLIYRQTGSWAMALGWNARAETIGSGALFFSLVAYSALAYGIYRASKYVGNSTAYSVLASFLALFPPLWVPLGVVFCYQWLKSKKSST